VRLHPLRRPVRLVAILMAFACAFVVTAAARAGAAAPSRANVKAFSLKLPAAGDLSLARVVVKVRFRNPASRARRVLRFNLANRSALPASVTVLGAGRRLASHSAVAARLVRHTARSATFVTYVALLNRKPGSARAHTAGGVLPQPVATFQVSEGADTVTVSVTFHQDIVANDEGGQAAECRAGSTVDFVFSRADYKELAGAMGLSPMVREQLFRAAVELCLGESNAADDQQMASELNVPSVTKPPVNTPPPLTCTESLSVDTPDKSQLATHGGNCNRPITGLAVWAPANTQFTACDPSASCKISSVNGGTNNYVYVTGSLAAGAPFPPGWNIEQSKPVDYNDTYEMQAWGADGTKTALTPVHASG
jgi:hypothetical protein